MLEFLAIAAVALAVVILVRQGNRSSRPTRNDRLVKRNDGKYIDARLPPGTILVDQSLGAQGGHYSPSEKVIRVVSKNNERRRLHEKAHAIWDLKLSLQQREKFNAIARQRGVNPDKKLCGQSGGCYPVGEEIFAMMYAGHKQGREFAKPFKPYFKEVLRK